MASPTVFTFEEALDRADKNRHVLLGNGFSIACRHDIFMYDALFDRADFERLSEPAKKAFQVLGTTDFEEVMKALQASSAIGRLYQDQADGLADQMLQDAAALREVLVNAIAGSHPDHPHEITPDEYAHCKQFLSKFNRIYTFNYDLLLYWTIMRKDIAPHFKTDDGFRHPHEEGMPYVTWEPNNTHNQNIYYLHGALHVFDTGTEVQKYTWANTGVRLTDQIRDALASNKYPLFVAEGGTDQKLSRIRHSDFLARGRESFGRIGGSLFIYGHSLAPNDEHYLKLIERNQGIGSVFVSLYGDPNSEANQAIIERALTMRARRGDDALQVGFYDAESASVWQ